MFKTLIINQDQLFSSEFKFRKYINHMKNLNIYILQALLFLIYTRVHILS